MILTKAGGLATTEALMKRLPLVYINAVPGCETRNLEFMTAHGYAATANTPRELAALAADLLRDSTGLTHRKEILARDFPGCAAAAIRSYLLKHQPV